MLVARQRVLFAAAGVSAICLSLAVMAAGFALTAVWPGVSWALGSALGLVGALCAGRWLRAAFTGRSPARSRDARERGGAI